MVFGIFSQKASGRIRGTGFKEYQQTFRLDIRENYFMERVVMPWNRQPREVFESPYLEGFKRCTDVALGDEV